MSNDFSHNNRVSCRLFVDNTIHLNLSSSRRLSLKEVFARYNREVTDLLRSKVGGDRSTAGQVHVVVRELTVWSVSSVCSLG